VVKLPPPLPKDIVAEIFPVEVTPKFDAEKVILPPKTYTREKVKPVEIMAPEMKAEISLDVRGKGLVSAPSKTKLVVREPVELAIDDQRYERMTKVSQIGDFSFGQTKLKAKLISTPEGVKGFFKFCVVKWTSQMLDPYFGNTRPVYNVYPNNVRELIKEMDHRTGLKCTIEGRGISLLDDELETVPIILFYGHVGIHLSNREKARLKKYLLPKEMGGMGGFAWFNDNMGPVHTSPFQKSAEGLAREFFPDHPLKTIPIDHPVYDSFYLFTSYPAYLQTSTHKFKEYHPSDYYSTGVEVNNRLVMILTPIDLVGRFIIPEGSRGEHPHSSPRVRELCLQLGINIIMYALSTSPMVDRTDYSP
jgi:hypothetical protein